jgi:hypothetical protein
MRLGLRPLALFSALAVSISCGTPAGRSALEITVTLAAGAKSACVIVEAGDERTDPMPVAGKSELRVGVVRSARMPASVPVVALGYSDAACQTRIVPTEQSDTVEATFQENAVVQVALRVAPVTGPTDLDGDGWAVPQDCKDGDPNVHPNAVESCTNQADEDCDGLIDCADPGCDAQSCAAGAVCGTAECRETVCNDGFDNDAKDGIDCADPDCTGKVCLNNGTCVAGTCQGATFETGLCGDGADNDMDGMTDCLDSDCAANSCSDGTYCTTGETCQGTTCAGGANVTCPATGPVCTVPATGVCQPGDGGCTYNLQPADAGCDDGNLCTVSDRCSADGGCSGQQIICATPPSVCSQPTGTCQPGDGGCKYDPRPAGSATCNDGLNCTTGDTCDGDGGCRGNVVPCVPGPCQAFAAGSCTDAGVCIFTATPNVACDGGMCNAQSACVPTVTWPYTPSNFTLAQLPTPSNTVTIGCTTATIRTQSAAPYAVFEGWCSGAVVPNFTLGTMNGATAPVIVSMLGLDVTNNSVLRVSGVRPVILAVQGDVTVSGDILAGAVAWQNGAGGNLDCPGNARPTTGSCNTNACGGGGGGGYGSAGRDGGNGEAGGAPGGVFGNSFGQPELVPLVGGCAGAAGGGPVAANRADGGGAGGGLQISARGTMTITGSVSSVGGGGSGALANSKSAGGGGGSGGAVLLEAIHFSMGNNGWISCNGGAGGEGSDSNDTGANGGDGMIASTSSATCSNDANNGGTGGQGATSTTAPANGNSGISTSEHGSGGGGGAGMGRVRINSSGTCSIGGGTITAIYSVRTIDGGTCQ